MKTKLAWCTVIVVGAPAIVLATLACRRVESFARAAVRSAERRSPEDPGAVSLPCAPGPTLRSGADFRPPAGIPTPPFGISEAAPPAPDSWKEETGCFYFVEPDHPNATDDDNPNGSPSRPRWTIPLDLPAGAVVELHGRYDYSHESPREIRARGTQDHPVFIRGTSPQDRPRITRPWEVSGSYLVMENLEFADRDGEEAGRLVIESPAADVTLRASELHGNKRTGGIGLGSDGGEVVTRVVLYRNRIHDNGDVEATYDQDVHGIAVGRRVQQLWVLDNEMSGNSGDGIQINGGRGGEALTHHIYVGRNRSHDNKQTGFWTKQASDVIFSENESWGHRPSNSSMGQGMGFQYAPERVWFLFNNIHDCDYGIMAASDNDLGSGTESYYVGNVIHAIHHSRGYNPDTAWSNAGIMLEGGKDRYVVGNTIQDVDAGINSPASNGFLHIANNIVSGVTEREGYHVFLESEETAARSSLRYNLLDAAGRVRWGDFVASSLSAFRKRFRDKAQGSLAADPGFADPAGDFHLLAGSPAVDAGTPDDVYSIFQSLYGLDIARDAAGTPLPQGRAPDLGAFEWTQ
jgi:hypothetical protein